MRKNLKSGADLDLGPIVSNVELLPFSYTTDGYSKISKYILHRIKA